MGVLNLSAPLRNKISRRLSEKVHGARLRHMNAILQNSLGRGAAPANRNWESVFRSWSTPPSETEQAKIDNALRAVRNAIDKSERLKQRKIKVFVQGSYRNRVNVRQDSDVDVGVMFCDGFLVQYPQGKTHADFGNVAASYTFAEFKNDLHAALVDHFGQAAVTRGNKAFDIKANTCRVDADVVPLFEFRQYWENGTYRAGVALVPDGGSRIENYPERLLESWPQTPLHYENGVSKNERTGRRFKGLVRIFKNLCNEMSAAGHAPAKAVPSYLLECLVWNVSDSQFDGETWDARVQAALLFLWAATRDEAACKDWREVDGLKYLFHAAQPWTRQQAYAFVDCAWTYVGVRSA